MLVQQFLEISATRLPGKVALVCRGRRFTYRQIDEMANRLAHAMISSGLERSDRVVILLKNSVEAVVAIFATLKANATFVVINSTTKQEKLTFILNNCRAKVLITDAKIAPAPLLASIAANCRHLQCTVLASDEPGSGRSRLPNYLSFQEIRAGFPASLPRRVAIDLDLACLIYTSGSTGEPKGVMSDHSNIEFVSGSIMEYLQNIEADVVINVLPLAFDYGLYQLLMTFRFGGTLVLEDSFAFPSEILRRIGEERVTGFPGVPTVFSVLMQMDLSKWDLSSLRYVTNTAAALPPQHIQELRKRLPNVQVYSMYGLTETKRTLFLPPQQLDVRPDSVGIAIPGTEVWLEDDEARRLPPGEIGELVVRGRHVMRGYWEDPGATAKRFVPGPVADERVCRTGDLFRTDEDGFFYFIGRKDDILKSRGEKVAPKEVENVLYGIPGVVEAAVVGVPDPVLGQAIKAFLVVRGRRLTQAEVRGHCQMHLEDFMVPKYVEFCDHLPKTSSGKIAKRDLVFGQESAAPF